MFEKEAYWVSWLRWHLYRKRRGKQGDAFKGALLKMRTAVRRLPRGALVLVAAPTWVMSAAISWPRE